MLRFDVAGPWGFYKCCGGHASGEQLSLVELPGNCIRLDASNPLIVRVTAIENDAAPGSRIPQYEMNFSLICWRARIF